MNEDDKGIINWQDIKFSRVSQRVSESEIDLEVMRRVEKAFAEQIDKTFFATTALPQQPLNLYQVASKLREKGYNVVCSWHDVHEFTKNLRRHKFRFFRQRKGYWWIFDTQTGVNCGNLYLSQHCEKGQNYIIPISEPFKYELKLDDYSVPNYQHQLLWSFAYRRYGR